MLRKNEIIVDSFAGGGGASLGIEMALGRSPDVAINHNAAALLDSDWFASNSQGVCLTPSGRSAVG